MPHDEDRNPVSRRDFARQATIGGFGLLGGAGLSREDRPVGRGDRASGCERVFDVRDFGAVGDGSSDDTAAVQATIDAAAESPETAPVYLPEGRYLVEHLSVPAGVSLIGTHVNQSVLRGTGSSAVLAGSEGWVRQRFRHFQITHEGNAAAAGAALVDQKFGARRCEFEDLKLVGVDGRTGYAVRLRGEHPDRGMVGLDESRSQGVFYNMLRNVHCRTTGGYMLDSPETIAFYLEGTTTRGARANLNLLERCHVVGWGTGFRLDEGHDNVFLNCKQEDTGARTSFPLHHLAIHSLGTDSETHDNLVIAQSFDASNSHQRVRLHNEQIQNHPTMVTFLGCRLFNPTTDITFTTGEATDEKPKYQAFGVIGGNRISDRDATTPAGDRSVRIGGAIDDGVASLDGGAAQDCGRFIAAARDYARQVEAVSTMGGASVSIRDVPDAEFRLVKTEDGRRYDRIWSVDREGVIDFHGDMDRSGKNPARDRPDQWVEVKIDGETHYLPAYRP